jgi:tungstate transport system ATP-binding protein
MHAAASPTPAPTGTALVSLRQAQLVLQHQPVLTDISLDVHPGERVALVGSNGSGKSSLLRLLHGLVPLASGQRQLGPGVRLSMLFQRPHVLQVSVWANVAVALWLNGTPWRQCRAEAHALLARVGLAERADVPARALSGGQQQRLALARALACRPHVLLLDEPTASLDPHAKREVEALMADVGQALPLVFASHNLGQVKRLATRVLYLEHGRVLADLPVEVFFQRDHLASHHPAAHQFVQGETA